MEIEFPILGFLLVLVTGCAVSDVRTGRIPNLLTYPAMALALVHHVVLTGLPGFSFWAYGLAVGIGIFLIPYLLGGMGAGDAKLMGAIGSLIGAKSVVFVTVVSALAGGVYALIIFFGNPEYTKNFLRRYYMAIKLFLFSRQFIQIPSEKPADDPKLRYGVSIAIGACVYIFAVISGYSFVA